MKEGPRKQGEMEGRTDEIKKQRNERERKCRKRNKEGHKEGGKKGTSRNKRKARRKEILCS